MSEAQATLFGGPEKESRRVQALTIYKAYPRRGGRAKALQHIEAALERIPFEELLARTEAFAEECKTEGTENKYIAMAKTYFGVDGCWLDEVRRPEKDAVLTRQRAIGDAAREQEADIKCDWAKECRLVEAAKDVLARHGEDATGLAYRRYLADEWEGKHSKPSLGNCTQIIAERLEPGCLAEVK